MKNRRKTYGALVTAAIFIFSVAAMAQEKMHIMTGEVKQIDASANTLTVKRMVGKKEKDVVLHLASETRITRNDQKVMLGDLKAGDRVTVKYVSEQGVLAARAITLKSGEAKPTKSDIRRSGVTDQDYNVIN